MEDVLQRHYKVLRGYLAPYLKDEAGNSRPTRARDKLLRLSSTQFHELSTDVYDELLRREDDRRRPGGGVPPSLPPKQTFHPKRNQARQKLSTLPPDRFRQLATDVFYELERRIPRLAGSGDMDRPGSAAGSVASGRGSRTGSLQGGMRYRGPPPPGMRPGPNGHPGPEGYGQYSPSKQVSPPPRLESRARAGSLAQRGPDDMRPVPQTFQSSTIVPNKSTMVEDDETDDEDAMGLSGKRSTVDSSASKAQQMREYESQVSELQERIHDLEDRLKGTEAEVQATKSREADLTRERDEWIATKADLDSRLTASQQSLENLHEELEQSHTERSQSESELRAQTERTVSDLQLELEEIRRENEALRQNQQPPQHSRELSNASATSNSQLAEELAAQRALTEEVRRNAQQFLQEMRLLSEQSELALEKEEQLRNQISSLEQETEHWKTRYTKARTQIRSLRASSLGLGIQHETDGLLRNRYQDGENSLMRTDGTGLVPDLAVSAYQISIDELLYAARDADTELALHKAKSVIKAVRSMVSDIDGDLAGIHSPSASSPVATVNGGTVAGSVAGGTSINGAGSHPTALKARITRDANRLVTAARTHATSAGLAPISILDAAASNLTASVVALLKVVGIRASSTEDLNHENADINDAHGDGTRARGYSEIAPLQLQPRSFADSNSTSMPSPPPPPAPVNYDSDAGMESPIIKGGFSIQQAQHDEHRHSETMTAQQQDAQKSAPAAAGGGIGGWFNMLKSPALSHKDSMVESEGESDDDRYGFA